MGNENSHGDRYAQHPLLGDESIMSGKAHGTTEKAPPRDLRWSVDYKTGTFFIMFILFFQSLFFFFQSHTHLPPYSLTNPADRICCFNRHYAEHSGYFISTPFWKEILDYQSPKSPPITFYDTVTGKPLFKAPIGRTWDEFRRESRAHGWPSFRDDEINRDNVRVLRNGETVSIDGTHLGHNLPDRKGNRYCINLVSVAGKRKGATTEKAQEEEL
eukprot:g1195.t1